MSAVATTIGPNCIQMWPSGVAFDVFDPDPAAIFIEDIAHHLSLQCRFHGGVRKRWSVAQHSMMVADLCPPDLKLAGLMHDAAEAYIGDLAGPIKRHDDLIGYCNLELHLEMVISKRFGINGSWRPDIKRADRVILACEAVALKHGCRAWDLEALDMSGLPLGIDVELTEAIRRANPPSDEYVRDEFLQMFRDYGGRA